MSPLQSQMESPANATFLRYFANFLGEYIDLDYSIWLYRLLTPLLITFLLPLIFVVLIYFTSIFLYVYKLHRRIIMQAVSSDLDFWNVGRKIVSAVWDAHAWLYHGYEVNGLHHLPAEGPALIVYYHGAVPIDMYYFVARVLLAKDRLIYTVADRFLFKIPGWGIISDACKVSPGTIQSCTATLRDGNLLAISPGGVYEAQFGDNCYELLWKNRIGFAKVALEARVPIIPMFTQNLREAFRSVGIMRRWLIKFYNATHIPLRPIYGGFPVKLRTFLGPPIPYDPKMSPEELKQKTAFAIEELINKHQRIPGGIFQALLDRFSFLRKRKASD
uniref:Putative phosphate acyltransferase n=1 Tax=Nyssomyia neivai TaxID=330878 RepID=A0A1L8DYJ6_9DIPT